MSNGPESRFRSRIVGDLHLPPDGTAGEGAAQTDPQERVPMLIELNVRYPGGLLAVTEAFYALWEDYAEVAGGSWPEELISASPVQPPVPRGLAPIAPKLYQCVLSRADLRAMMDKDRRLSERNHRPPIIFRVWPHYPLHPQIDRSAPTVKADAAWRSYNALGHGVVWAVIDSGIDACHPHFSQLELAAAGRKAMGQKAGSRKPASRKDDPPDGLTSNLHRDFSFLVNPGGPADQAAPRPLVDDSGHGTHVAGIITGCTPDGKQPRVAESRDPGVLRVHGVNMSLGSEWQPDQYAAGQSPLCQAVNQLVASGVVVVVSAGNYGARTSVGDAANTSAIMGSITEPAHAEDCIAVGSTHREAPHAFGVTWTSGKGPTLDGRMKPDVVAPGEWIASAASGEVRAQAGLDPPGGASDLASLLTYAEQSGTSMAAPHVSGVIAAFLSARPEFIGRPRQVKSLLTASATDIGRERFAQGAGLVDLMRMLANV